MSMKKMIQEDDPGHGAGMASLFFFRFVAYNQKLPDRLPRRGRRAETAEKRRGMDQDEVLPRRV